MVTEHDNRTHDMVKHGGWIGLALVVGLAIHQEALHVRVPAENPVPVIRDVAIAISTILAGCGAGVALKRRSEHDGGDQ